MNKGGFLLASILVLAFTLRLFQLGQNPPSLTWDEVAWGYNAYTLGVDGRDEFGRFLPLDYLESFGDFKPPVYAYLAAIPIKFWGLSEFSIRLPSAVLGSITVLLTYFLTKYIFYTRKQQEGQKIIWISLASALVLAVSPWHINLSRAAFEANVATFFIVFAVLSFLLAIHKNSWFLVLSAVSFVLSLYTFNTARIVAPLLVIVLAIGFTRQLLAQKRMVILAVIVGFFLLLPSLRFLTSPQARLRFDEVNIFSDVSIITRVNKEIENDHNAWWSKIIHNRRLTYSVEYLRHYLDNLNPSFLFIKGDGNPKFSTQDVGELYLWDVPFIVLGILYILKEKKGHWWIIPLWLILGIVPAGTARETPHALRIETVVPMMQIIVGYGLVSAIVMIKNNITRSIVRYGIYTAMGGLLLFNITYYLHGYYTHYAREFSKEWQYGYKEAIAYISTQKDLDGVWMTSDLGRPYSYMLFYLKIDPSLFRETASIRRDVFGFVNVDGFDKYHFGKETFSLENKRKKVLFIDMPQNVPIGANVVKTFYLLNGNPSLVAYLL